MNPQDKIFRAKNLDIKLPAKVSVIICTYTINREKDLNEAIQSVLKQTYEDLEVVIVVDGNENLFKITEKKFSEVSNVKVLLCGSRQQGFATCLNYGIRHSFGDIICFLDDDAIASDKWIPELLRAYQNDDAYGVGGSILPLWLSEKPDFLPDELFWLIGSSVRFFPPELTDVRNAWGSNVSFRKEVFKKVGIFSPVFGRKGNRLLQAEDADFGLRCLTTLGKGITFSPRAVVYHKIYPERVRMRSLMARAFEQGFSKALICKLHGGLSKLSTEKSYLRVLISAAIPKYFKHTLLGSSRVKAVKQLLFMVTIVTLVFTGFLAGFLKGKMIT